jgi:hypothetical protein
MLNPWDDGAQQVRHLHDEGDHVVIGITVSAPEAGDDDRFSLCFEIAGSRTLRLRLPSEQLVALGECCLRLAEARRHVGAS